MAREGKKRSREIEKSEGKERVKVGMEWKRKWGAEVKGGKERREGEGKNGKQGREEK